MAKTTRTRGETVITTDDGEDEVVKGEVAHRVVVDEVKGTDVDVERVDKPALDAQIVEMMMAKALELAEARASGREALAEPEEDELDEDVIFVRNGWVRLVIAGEKHKLRRPFLGELRDLEASMEADTQVLEAEQRAIHTQAEKAIARAKEIGEEAMDLAQDDPRKMELDAEATELGVEVSRLSRLLVHKAYELRDAWWSEVFKVLTPPGNKGPEMMPSWVGDPELQAKVVQHWRSVPLASGR